MAKKKRQKRPPAWVVVFRNIDKDYAIDDLDKISPFEDPSMWDNWISRIKKGQKEEEQRLVDELGQYEAEPGSDYYEYLCGLGAGKRSEIELLTNNMFASILVTMWSEIELFLRQTAGVFEKAGINEAELRERPNNSDIVDFYKKVNVGGLPELPGWDVTNAVRILNNMYKHENGYYYPGENEHDKIAEELCEKWKIKENEKISYADLPFDDCIRGCGSFREHFCKKAYSILDEKCRELG